MLIIIVTIPLLLKTAKKKIKVINKKGRTIFVLSGVPMNFAAVSGYNTINKDNLNIRFTYFMIPAIITFMLKNVMVTVKICMY